MTKWTLDRLASAGAAAGIVAEFAAERARQIGSEGFDFQRDDEYVAGELALAVAGYAQASVKGGEAVLAEGQWPWDPKWLKADDRRQALIKAGALLVAEIERLDRAARAELAKEAQA